jgi:hypothetical protein
LRQQVPRDEFSLTGWIKQVRADYLAEANKPLSGVVVVEARVEGRTRDVQVDLSGPILERAAAGVGRYFFSAVGTLEKIGRRWVLSNPREISLRD